MEFIENKLATLKTRFAGLDNYQVTAKANAVVSLHKKDAPDKPQARCETNVDSLTVDVPDLLVAGALLCAAGAALALFSSMFD